MCGDFRTSTLASSQWLYKNDMKIIFLFRKMLGILDTASTEDIFLWLTEDRTMG